MFYGIETYPTNPHPLNRFIGCVSRTDFWFLTMQISKLYRVTASIETHEFYIGVLSAQGVGESERLYRLL